MQTSIPHSKGIKASKHLRELSKKNSSHKSNHCFSIVNIGVKQLCVQLQKLFTKKRLAMGTICAPAYTNILMGQFDRKYIHPLLEGLSLSYFRFLDDILFIWTGSKDQLITFLNDLNTKHNSVKFEYKISQSKIYFLDANFISKTIIYTQRIIEKKQTD